MRMKSKKWMIGVLGAVLACVLAVAPIQAALLFDGGMATRWLGPDNVQTGLFFDPQTNTGYRAAQAGDTKNSADYLLFDLDVHPMNPDQGTIILSLVRNEEFHAEALFSLTDASGQRIFLLEILWDNGPSFYVIGPPEARVITPTSRVPFPHPVAQGQAFEVTVSWSTSTFELLLDGEDTGAMVNDPANFPNLVRSARHLIVGAETDPDKIPDGAWSQLGSLLTGFEVYDQYGAEPLPAISSLDHDAYTVAGFSGALVEDDELTVTMEGTAGQEASFDIARRPTSSGKITLDWRGYYDEAENAVALEDVDFYRVYAAPTYFTSDDVAKYRLAADDKYLDLGPGVYRAIEQVGEIAGDDGIQTFLVEDLDPYLTYFVMVTAVDEDDSMVISTTDASGAAVEEWIDLEEVIIAPVGGLAMAEDLADPGIYSGILTVGGDLDYPEAVVIGHLSGPGGTVSAEAEDTFPIDTSVRILVSASPSNLKADEESTSEITVEVRNANGDTISGHPVALSLTTTSEYTGVIGGGQFEDEVGGELSLDFSGETDLFGTVTATFTAGFAAKTAVIVAKDLVTNDVGSGYVTQYIEGTTDIELIGLRPSAAKAAGYTVVVTSNRDWLTADGSSRANITAQVLQDGNPVSGHSIIFSVVGEGRVSVINSVTDGEGYARAVYTAGTRIGWVLIKATDVTVGISGSTQIELRSDAPAKVAFLVDVLDPVDPADSLGSDIPELYADGSSKAALEVLVTDINDNPNKDTEVDFSVAVGSGSLEEVISLTDEDGKAYATYVAGQIPGTVTVKVTVSSRPPTEAEKAAAENAVLTVPDFEFIVE